MYSRCNDLVLLITIQWCSFTVQNQNLQTYQMLAWYGNWLSHNVGRFYRQTVRMQKNQTKPIVSVLYKAHCKKQHVPFMKGRILSSSHALLRSKRLHSESEAVQCLADHLPSSLWQRRGCSRFCCCLGCHGFLRCPIEMKLPPLWLLPVET